MTPNAIVATAIRRERELAQLTLSALAAKAGLAKSTLSQLESGNGNPNVETLWAIATALNIPFSALFETASIEATLIRANEGVTLTSAEAEFTAVLLDRCPPERRRDLYRVRLRKGAPRHSAAHPAGTREHAVLCSGRMRIGPVESSVELRAGDYFRFGADAPHLYEALSDEALLLIVMDNPR